MSWSRSKLDLPLKSPHLGKADNVGSHPLGKNTIFLDSADNGLVPIR